MRGSRFASALLASLFFVTPSSLYAAELLSDTQITSKAEVLEVLTQEKREIPGTDTESVYQTISVKIIDGEEAGKEITLENDYLSLTQGEVFYLTRTISRADGTSRYAVSDPYRLPALGFFTALLFLAVVVIGGIQGIRGLVALLGSFFCIAYILIPGIFAGYSPVLLATCVSSLIIILGSYITHGFTRTTSSAVFGMIATIILTGALAAYGVHSARLSGFESEESIYLNFNTQGAIDFSGLLLGGIMIGLLGVLYDVAIGQAIAVEELHRAAPHLDKKTVYARGIRIGREHIGALVNTLAIAYVGVSLPLLLLFYNSEASLLMTLNREVFATEIMRILIGSIGLILAVPITTALSVVMIVKNEPDGMQASHLG